MKIFTRQLSTCFALLFLYALTGCGGGGGGSSSSSTNPPAGNPPAPQPTVFTGIYIDSAVEGLNYRTASQTGMTNSQGEFSYQSGETIIFSIGDIDFPSVSAKEILTPLDIFDTTDYSHVGVINMARLLQSLDQDGVAANGITISSNVHSVAAGLSVDFNDADFDSMVETLVANSGGNLVTLISSAQAIAHLQLSLDDAMGTGCGNDHAKVGFNGNFSTIAHGVSGTATIVNNCTIEVTLFNYDGGGPSVYFYGAIDHRYDESDAFIIGSVLNGQSYIDRTLTYDLPTSKTLDDFNTLSVWCNQFDASFGELVFTAP